MQKHDFHIPLKDSNQKNIKFDFIYTNSYDHAHSPVSCLGAMYDNLKKTGIIIIDMHESSSSLEATKLDPHVFTVESVLDYINSFNNEGRGELFMINVHSINSVSKQLLCGKSQAEINKLIGMGIAPKVVNHDALEFSEESVYLIISKKTPQSGSSLNHFVDFSLNSLSFMESICNADYTEDMLSDDLLRCCFGSISIAEKVQQLFLAQSPFNWNQGFASDEEFYEKYSEHCIKNQHSVIKNLRIFL